MIVDFKVARNGEFGLLVEGFESDQNQYQPKFIDGSLVIKTPVSFGTYKWEQSVTIDVIADISSEGTETFIEYKVNNHNTECCYDHNIFELKHDGLIKISHIILPNQYWIADIENIPGIAEDAEFLTRKVYYYDDVTNKFWKKVGVDRTQVTFKEVYDSVPSTLNSAFKVDRHIFTMNYIEKCYNLLIKDLLKCVQRSGECPTPAILSRERERDLILMFKTAMKYAREMNLFFEAQRILERLNICNTICTQSNLSSHIKFTGCGC